MLRRWVGEQPWWWVSWSSRSPAPAGGSPAAAKHPARPSPRWSDRSGGRIENEALTAEAVADVPAVYERLREEAMQVETAERACQAWCAERTPEQGCRQAFLLAPPFAGFWNRAAPSNGSLTAWCSAWFLCRCWEE